MPNDYYILTKDRGPFALLWRAGGCGYTSQLDKAGRFTAEDATRERLKYTDSLALPCSVVEQAAVRVVRWEEVSKLVEATHD